MAWTIEFSDTPTRAKARPAPPSNSPAGTPKSGGLESKACFGLQQLSKLDKPVARRLVDFMEQRIACLDNPRALGESLKGPKLVDFWKYRMGDWCVVCDIQDLCVVVQVVRVGNRREVYRRN